jgi:hypothetical protein
MGDVLCGEAIIPIKIRGYADLLMDVKGFTALRFF